MCIYLLHFLTLALEYFQRTDEPNVDVCEAD